MSPRLGVCCFVTLFHLTIDHHDFPITLYILQEPNFQHSAVVCECTIIYLTNPIFLDT